MSWYLSSLFAQAAAPSSAPAPTSIPWYVHLLIFAATLVISFTLGNYLGKKLRMPDHGWKIGLTLFSFLVSIAILFTSPPVKLGIDLRGGVYLTYEVDHKNHPEALSTAEMNNLIDSIRRRVNPSGAKEVVVRSRGADQVEIIVPQATDADVQALERTVSTTGNLEFCILATQHDDAELMERARENPGKDKIFDRSGRLLAWWVPVVAEEAASMRGDRESAVRPEKPEEGKPTEVLLKPDPYHVTGGYLAKAETGTDQEGRPCVNFTFNSRGASLFGELTGSHLPDAASGFQYRLGIVLDGVLRSAPSIRSRISDRGEITGSFTQEQVQELVNVLNAGSLPAALTKDPISKQEVGPTLGSDTIKQAGWAMIIAAALVPLFMLMYYRFCGVVADLALVLNMLILFSVMLTLKVAFTLTGLVGLALTVGMAVDNNVLVFERLREEQDRGATLRMAIRNAFHRAGATIVDCNLTHLIAASVLYWLGNEQLRGFAIPLWIGVATSMYTSVFVAHVIFDVAEKRRWIAKANMARWIGHTNIDFMGLAPYCIAASILITVAGAGLAVWRHHEGTLLDIDFTGGVSAQVVFDQPQNVADVRSLLEKEGTLKDVTVTDVKKPGEPGVREFIVNTSTEDIKILKSTLARLFGNKLAHNTVTFTEPKLIVAAAPSPAAGPKPAAPAKAGPGGPKKPAEAPSQHQSRSGSPQGRTHVLWCGRSGGAIQARRPRDTVQAPRPRYTMQAPRPHYALQAGRPHHSVLLALADAPARPEKPAVPRLAEGAAKQKPAEQLVPAPPVETPPKAASQNPPPGRPAAQPPTSQPEAPSAESAGRFVGGTQSDLAFRNAVQQAAVEEWIRSAIEAAKLDPRTFSWEVSRPAGATADEQMHWIFKTTLAPQRAEALLTTLQTDLATQPIFASSNKIGGAVAADQANLAIIALVVSWSAIILYLWVRFQGVAFGLAAVVALIHDIFVMLGAVAVSVYIAPYLGWLLIEPVKLNLSIVAAFLTIVGYSVNDTIVVFDRIREVRGKDPNLTRKMVNDSTNQTLSRTLLTSLTVFLVIIVLYIFGGIAMRGLAFALLVGVSTGTYSSIYVAAPILLWLVGKHRVAGQSQA